MDDRAGAQKQQRLEEGMGVQMKDAGGIGRDAAGEEHVAELGAGGIRDHPLDVVLHQADGRGEERGGRADEGDESERGGRELEQRRAAGDQEHAGGDHGRGVDQRGHRGRPFHGVRQPGVQPDLRGLAHGADEQKDADHGQRMKGAAEHHEFGVGELARAAEHHVELDRIEHEVDGGDAERQTDVADPVDQKRLDRRSAGGGSRVPVADQQIGNQADAFPAEIQLQEVVRGDQGEHEEREQRQIAHEARHAAVVRHVADRVDVDQRRDRAHREHHHGGEHVDADRPIHLQRAGMDPTEQLDLVGLAAQRAGQHGPGAQRRKDQAAAGHQLRAAIADRAPDQAGDDRAEQREEDHAGGEHALAIRRPRQDARRPSGARPCHGPDHNGPDQGCRLQHLQPRIRLMSSTSMLPRLRKYTTRMARPIAASAAATVSTNMANTWPARSPR